MAVRIKFDLTSQFTQAFPFGKRMAHFIPFGTHHPEGFVVPGFLLRFPMKRAAAFECFVLTIRANISNNMNRFDRKVVALDHAFHMHQAGTVDTGDILGSPYSCDLSPYLVPYRRTLRVPQSQTCHRTHSTRRYVSVQISQCLSPKRGDRAT